MAWRRLIQRSILPSLLLCFARNNSALALSVLRKEQQSPRHFYAAQGTAIPSLNPLARSVLRKERQSPSLLLCCSRNSNRKEQQCPRSFYASQGTAMPRMTGVTGVEHIDRDI